MNRSAYALYCGVLLALLSACGQRPSPVPVAAGETPEVNVTAPPTPALGANILFNPSFELWDGKNLQGWAVAEGQGAVWTPISALRAKGIHRASYAVAIKQPPAGHYAILAQNLAQRWIQTGKTLYFGAVVLAEKPHQAQVVLSFRVQGQEKKVRAVHPGDGTWQSVHDTVDVPADADPASFRLELFRNPDIEGRVIFDDAGVAYAAETAPASGNSMAAPLNMNQAQTE